MLLVASLLPAGVQLASLRMRLLVSGLTPPECDILASAAASVTGASFEVITTSARHRVALFERFDPDDPLLSHVSEYLDTKFESPLLVSGCAPWSDVSVLQEVCQEAVDKHISTYGLCVPIEPRTEWQPRFAQLAAYWTIDGAIVKDREHSWWDVSEVAVWDGIVDPPLRRALLALLHGPDWDAENGVDPRVWQRGIFTDVSSTSQDEGGGQAGGGGWGLREEMLAQLCAEPAAVPVAELEARLARLLAEANEGRTNLCRMASAVLGDEITPLAANAPVSSDGDLFSWVPPQ